MEDLETMINEINDAVDKTLSFTHYAWQWELSSYKDDSLFCIGNYLKNESFTELIKEAHAVILNLREKEESKCFQKED